MKILEFGKMLIYKNMFFFQIRILFLYFSEIKKTGIFNICSVSYNVSL
jgi:hypothetical protein